jgi:hypothetical protein
VRREEGGRRHGQGAGREKVHSRRFTRQNPSKAYPEHCGSREDSGRAEGTLGEGDKDREKGSRQGCGDVSREEGGSRQS